MGNDKYNIIEGDTIVFPDVEKLDTEVKSKWVCALRSGNYKQGSSALMKKDIEKDKNSYCCLGVLAIILNPDSSDVIRGKSFVTPDLKLDYPEFLLYSSPESIQTKSLIKYLACMNDGSNFIHFTDKESHDVIIDKRSFSEIADYIEEYL